MHNMTATTQLLDITPAITALSRYTNLFPEQLIYDVLSANEWLREENNNSIGDAYPREWLLDELCKKLKLSHWPINGNTVEYAYPFMKLLDDAAFNYRAKQAIRHRNTTELHVLGEKALHMYSTRHLLSMLPHHYGYYTTLDEDAATHVWRTMVKNVLATREHIPSKQQGKALRREAAKRKT